MSNADKHIKKIMKGLIEADGVPMDSKVHCLACKNPAKFVDHGPHVGKGWYCVVCKDDVDHFDNTYGLSGKSKARPSLEMSTHYGASYNFVDLNCTNSGCKACSGYAVQRPTVNLNPGDFITVVNSVGIPALTQGSTYKVTAITTKGVKVLVPQGLSLVEQEYARCRFRKVVQSSKAS